MPLFALPSDFGILKKFLTHLSSLMVLNLTIKPAYLLVVDAKIQDALGPEAWGNFFPLLSLSILLNILLDAGLANHTTRAIAQNPEGLNGHFQSGWQAKGMLFPIYLLALLATGYLLGYRGISLQWLGWVGINQALLSAVLYVRAGLQGAGEHRADAWVSIADRALLLVGLGALLFACDAFQLEWLLGGTTAALTCSLLLGSLRIQELRKALPVPLTASPKVWAHFKSSWPYALLFLLMMTYHRVDAIMLERMAPNGAVQAGWYAMGYRLFEAANMIGFLFATLLLPYFTRMLSAGEDIRPLAAGISRLLFVGGGSVAWVAAFFAPAFLGLFYASFLNEAAPILPWLMASFTVFAQGYVYSTLLTARGDLKLLNRLAALGAVANVAGNAWWLSQADGSNAALGCAVVSAGTQVLVVGLQTASAMRFHPGRIWWKVGQTALLHSLACAAICGAFLRWANTSGWSVVLCLLCCIAAGALPGIAQTQTLRQLLSDKMNTFADS